MKKLYSTSFFLVIWINCIFAQPLGGKMPQANTENIINKFLDISYATQSNSQKLDIYLPNDVKDSYPVIISIHGGAFKMGDKSDFQVNAMLEGLKEGYAVVSINYRLSNEAKFPAQIHDVKAAIRWVKANAKKYKFNADKIAVWGASAGGNLSALAGTSGDVDALEDLSMGNEKYSSRVQAVVDWFGPIDFSTMDTQFRASGKGRSNHNDDDSPESALIGKKITLANDLVQMANPSTYITKDDPPFLIEHGVDDNLVPTEQSIIFFNALKNLLGEQKVILNLLPNTRHGGKEFETKENLNLVFSFLDKYLKK